MKKKMPSGSVGTLNRSLAREIAAAQKTADAAKKSAKAAKAAFKHAKKDFKEARRLARQAKKIVKQLQAELAVPAERKPAAAKRATSAKRTQAAVLPPSSPAEVVPQADLHSSSGQ